MEHHGWPRTAGGLRSTAAASLADGLRALWGQITGGGKGSKERGEERRRREERDEVVEASLQDSRTFLLTLSCRSFIWYQPVRNVIDPSLVKNNIRARLCFCRR